MAENNLESFETVLVTGFGSFRHYVDNPSWEVVKLLKTLNFYSHKVNLVAKQVPVEYEKASEIIPELWSEHKPKLVVHLGVSPIAKHITLETCARRGEYKKADNLSCCPKNSCAAENSAEVHMPKLNLQAAAAKLNETSDCKFELSKDAGLFLCEFVFYVSLNIDCERTVFVHVPDPTLEKNYSPSIVAKAVQQLILLLLKEL